MEQKWTDERHDVPEGDLEFWARRRGDYPPAGNPNDRPVPDRRGARPGLRLVAAVTWFAIVLGLAVQVLILATGAA